MNSLYTSMLNAALRTAIDFLIVRSWEFTQNKPSDSDYTYFSAVDGRYGVSVCFEFGSTPDTTSYLTVSHCPADASPLPQPLILKCMLAQGEVRAQIGAMRSGEFLTVSDPDFLDWIERNRFSAEMPHVVKYQIAGNWPVS